MRVLVLCALVAVTQAQTVPLAYGQVVSYTSSTPSIATITCDTANTFYASTNVTSVSYILSGNTWTPQSAYTYMSLVCAGSCNGRATFTGPFGDVPYAGCPYYSLSSGVYYNYCTVDSVTGTYNGQTVTQYVYSICSECGVCVDGAARLPAPTQSYPPAIPDDLSRTVGTNPAQTYGAQAVLTDSPLTCATNGVTEVDTSNGRGSFGTISTVNPPVNWDFCPKTNELTCQDNPLGWQDSNGLGCEDYGLGPCSTRAPMQSNSQAVGFGGTFASFAAGSYDATQACCICGGGTKQCHVSDVDNTYPPYIYNMDDCDNIYAGQSCSVNCYINPTTPWQSTCNPGDANFPQSLLSITNFPDPSSTLCSSTYANWGIAANIAGNPGENIVCGGTPASTVVPASGKYFDCIQAAEQSCATYVSWFFGQNQCQLFTADQCTTTNSVNNVFTMARTGSQPNLGIAPTISCSEATVNGVNSVQISVTSYVCLSAGSFTATVSWTGFSSGSSAPVTVTSNTQTVSIPASSFSLNQQYSFTAIVQSGSSSSPVSNTCSLTVR